MRLVALIAFACLLAVGVKPGRADDEFRVVGTITVRDVVGHELFRVDCRAAFTIIGITLDDQRYNGQIEGCAYDVQWSKTGRGSNWIDIWMYLTPRYAECEIFGKYYQQGNSIEGRPSVKLHNDITVFVRCPYGSNLFDR
jgi:hypothetical protein